MTSIKNPGTPFVTTIPGGSLQVGSIILIQGEPSYNCNRFNVSFLCGPQPDKADVAFQFNPRFDMEWVIRNSKQKKQWGTEEGTALSVFPFRGQQSFKLEIFTSPSAFSIAIDGHHYCDYVHRVPFSEADTLQIQGDVKIQLVEFKNTDTFPIYPPINRLNVVNPPLPFLSLINGIIEEGGEIQVHGRVHQQPNRFHVNLQQGCHIYPHPNIALHINPRFEDGNRVVVMNSWYNKWGTEQRITGRSNPFYPGAHFILIIRRQVTHFQILVNGSRITTFNHRMIADAIDSVAIDGDVSIEKVVAL